MSSLWVTLVSLLAMASLYLCMVNHSYAHSLSHSACCAWPQFLAPNKTISVQCMASLQLALLAAHMLLDSHEYWNLIKAHTLLAVSVSDKSHPILEYRCYPSMDTSVSITPDGTLRTEVIRILFVGILQLLHYLISEVVAAMQCGSYKGGQS